MKGLVLNCEAEEGVVLQNESDTELLQPGPEGQCCSLPLPYKSAVNQLSDDKPNRSVQIV